MFREMITFPIRAGVCATRLAVHITARAAGVALGITRLAFGATEPEEPDASIEVGVVIVSSPPPAEPTAPVAPASFEVAPEPMPTVTAAPELSLAPEDQSPTEIPPAHVSEGLEFVESFAEPGAEEGAGAAVHVREPWSGYAQMTADQVIGRLVDATPEELASVALYEGAHRRRKTVLAAARRQLQAASAGQAELTGARAS